MAEVKHQFAYWIEEREKIRTLREAGHPKPWSSDPVFQTVYFCNADREDDKVTKWIRQNFHPSYMSVIVPNMIMARMVNKPDSLARLEWPWGRFSSELFCNVMHQKGTWGSAYIVSTNGRQQPKHEYIAGLLERAWQQFEGYPGAGGIPNLNTAHSRLQGLPGLGSFMAAQVVADLKNQPGCVLNKSSDWHTFAAHGPGSLRGLSWFHGESVTPSIFMDRLVSARQWCYNNGYKGVVEELCNQNLQNCFCEFDKYMRVAGGHGRSKRKYDGR